MNSYGEQWRKTRSGKTSRPEDAQDLEKEQAREFCASM